ncbi:MAG: lamin tail domain-containing protein [Verrucomicrobia bacterium]|nr:lamin tail domain-containing protein [Verrucomicrobiota bacterium]
MRTIAVALALFFVQLSAPAQTNVAEGVVQVGNITHFAISEGSGLAASSRYTNVVWTHNDGGYQFLFAVNRAGDYLGAFQVTGANLIDWEAIASDGNGNLYLADIGANGIERTHIAVHRVREPNPADRYGNAEVNKTWYLRFPDEREDCEAFFVLNDFGYLITKPRTNDQVTMFRYPLTSGGRSVLLEEVARISVTAAVTDAGLSADQQRLGIVTTEGVYLYFIKGNPASMQTAEREFTRFPNDFMEGGTFVDGGFLTSAETRELWLFTNANFVCTSPPNFTIVPADRSVQLSSNIELEAEVDGCPKPVLQWTFNGAPLTDGTNATLLLPSITVNDAGTYVLTASNTFGVITTSVTLTVRTKPDLRITEVMPSPALDATVPTADWWELTSFESQLVALTGWRFNDSNGGLFDPYVFTAGPTIAPGETIVFIENLTAAEFRNWWGETNLPAGLQIFSYSGSGLSFRITGDTLFLWDNLSTDPNDAVSRADFGIADTGVTFNYDPLTQLFGAKSVLGSNGVLRAASSSDIGSPGRIAAPPPDPTPGTNTPPAQPIAVPTLSRDNIRIEFDVTAGFRYTLEVREDLSAGEWTATGVSHQATANERTFLEVPRTPATRFFRLRVE